MLWSNLANEDVATDAFANENITIDVFTDGDCDWI